MTTTTRLSLLGLLTLLLGAVDPAPAAVIMVTMKDDVVADDGRCSLREAVDAANLDSPSGRTQGECVAGQRSPVVDVIQLRRGIYRLKRGGRGDDLNVGGDLDVTESVIIQGKGQKGTVIQNGIGDPTVAGDGDRLFHVDPGAAGGVDVTFSKLTLARGDVSCAGEECDPGGSAVENRGSGSLTLESCMVMRNTSTCTGDGCGLFHSGSAIASLGDGSLTIRGTTIKKNATSCASPRCLAGPAAIAAVTDGGVALASSSPRETAGDVVIDDTTITQNESSCEAASCGASGAVQVGARNAALRAASVTMNGSRCAGVQCGTAGAAALYAELLATAEDVEVSGNETRCSDEGCYVGRTFVVSGREAALRGATFGTNSASCDGADCYIAGAHAVEGLRAVADGIDVRDHSMRCTGERCEIEPLLLIQGEGPADVTDVALVGNAVECAADRCRAGTVAALSGVPLATRRTELARSQTSCSGSSCVLRSLLKLEAREGAVVEELAAGTNVVGCEGAECGTEVAIAISVDGDLTLVEPVIRANDVRCTGTSCIATDLLAVSTENTEIQEADIAENKVRCEGSPCYSGGIAALFSSGLLASDAFVGDNTTRCTGAGCRGVGVLRILAADGTIEGSVLSGNQARCDGEDCATGTGGALRSRATILRIRDSELSSNATDGFGGAIFNDGGSQLILERTSVVLNEAGLRGVMEFGGFGGGIYNDTSDGGKGTLQLIDSEVSNNLSLRLGGGVLNEGTVAPLVRSSIIDNRPSDCVNLASQGGSGCP